MSILPSTEKGCVYMSTALAFEQLYFMACLYRCVKMALVHDLAECLIGDLLPNEVSKEEKYRREKVKLKSKQVSSRAPLSIPIRGTHQRVL